MGYELDNRRKPYTEHDIEVMRKWAQEDGGLRKAAKELDRPTAAVSAKAHSLRIFEPKTLKQRGM